MSNLCLACRSELLSFFGKRLSYDYHLCGACGSLQLCPVPTEAELRAAYASDYAASSDAMHDGSPVAPAVLNGDHERYHRRIVDVVKESGVSGPILEIGCGFGGLGAQALRAGLPWEGIDLSEQAVAYCRKLGLPVRLADLSEVTEKQFGAIVMCFVFEHLTDYDSFLSSCRHRLLPNGRIITLHPTARFAHLFGSLLRMGNKDRQLPRLDSAFVPPWHTALVSISGIRALATRNGFRVEQVLPSPTGRFGSMTRRTAQFGIQCINRVGWTLAGESWPLTPAHLVVMQAV
jgi:SAM-dependent methyltransferase